MSERVLTFEPKEHIYRVDGVRVPSVTQVLGLAGMRDFSKIPTPVLENKRELGDLVHMATELDAFDDLDEDTVDEQVWPYLKAWRKFMSDTGATIVTAESRVDHFLYGYAGKLDHQVILNTAPGIIDKKTGVPDPSDGLQLAAYERALNYHNPRAPYMKRWGLYLANDETYKLVEYTAGSDFQIFLAALTVAKWRMANG